MTKQPEALRLADILEKMPLGKCDEQAAAELRRLHEVNQELLEALRINLEVLEKVDPYKGQEDLLIDVVCMNKELIAKATGEQV